MRSFVHGALVVVKSELIEALQKRMPDMMLRDVELAVNAILEQMAKALETGERIEVRGFGAFSLHQHPARKARNPKTGEAVHVLSRSVVHFKPGKEMRDRVDAAKLQYRISD